MKIQYDTKKSLVERIFLLEIVKGLGLTLRRLFSKSVTIQYPKERKELFPGFRGKHALIRDPKTGTARCVACMRCASVCPARCISIRFTTDEKTGGRKLESYEIDALRCIFCGYCEEVCPVNAVVLTEDYEYSDYEREPFHFDMEALLNNWDKFVEKNKIDPERYLNPFLRPRGLALGELPAGKRMDVPEEWTLEGQVVWKDGKAVSAREAAAE
ncbi:MAG: NADH-quinone oxidoreductase subunit NuoI [Thermodesulfobacteria bacterium]|nr:NADH-quinone oxidoreductase subunit NuoI [Thermodesulfobacteriota bacterium]